jgi:HPt (histidine-containing phosphotransfer) domain-containing protein
MSDHIGKPIDPDHLRMTLVHWLRQGNSRPGEEAAEAAAREAPQPDARNALYEILEGFDVDRALGRTGGNVARYRRFLTSFARGYHGFAARQEDAQGAEDWESARRNAHTLKGSAGTVGAVGLQDAAERLEQACVDEDPAEARRRLGDVAAQLDRALRMIDALDLA